MKYFTLSFFIFLFFPSQGDNIVKGTYINSSYNNVSITCETYNLNPNLTIPFGTTTSVINIPEDLTIQDINVCLDISHPFDSNLSVKLIAPDGLTEVVLFQNIGGNGVNFTNTCFDDDASQSINDGSPPFTADWIPQGSLADFNNMSSLGDWTLSINDNFLFDDGTLNSWSIEICSDTLSNNNYDISESNLDIINLKNRLFNFKLQTKISSSSPKISIYNLQGQLMHSDVLVKENGSNYNQLINLSNLSSGIYIVRVNSSPLQLSKLFIVD